MSDVLIRMQCRNINKMEEKGTVKREFLSPRTPLPVSKDYLLSIYRTSSDHKLEDPDSHWPAGLKIDFQFLMEERSKGLLRLQWSGGKESEKNFPFWEFAWDGGFSPYQIQRISRVLDWAIEQAESRKRSWLGLHAYSRCKEVYVEMPTLKQDVLILKVCEILHVEAKGELSKLYYGHKQEAVIKMVDLCIGKCEELLEPYGFVRIHRRHLVNHGCIKHIDGSAGGGSILLCSGDQLPIARRRFKEIKALLARHAGPY